MALCPNSSTPSPARAPLHPRPPSCSVLHTDFRRHVCHAQAAGRRPCGKVCHARGGLWTCTTCVHICARCHGVRALSACTGAPWQTMEQFRTIVLPCRLPAKRDADPSAVPVLFAFTDVGQLNTFIELWRFPSSAASVQAREKARKATAWTEAMAAITPSVGWFRSSLLRPVWWSNWQ